MLRTATFLAFIPATLAVAAPVPPPSEKEQLAKLWGKTFAASDKYEFSLVGKQLTIRTAGEPTRRATPGTESTIPRVGRTATGDFEATVRVVSAPAPLRTEKHEEWWPASRAGLFVS